ncbi:diaminopimelate epimerase [Niabella insulamsoli]|uniref:diaminopimelate epimerase n=1 Tax=Niabella insulamsoli TaxID=3144874 RepID=UPI0031FD2A43
MRFYKYQGTGNDFVIVDNREVNHSALSQQTIQHICDRRFGVGADGFMLLNNKSGYDFEMIYYNADGREGSMCGNGGRCIVQFAHDIGISKSDFNFLAVDGIHLAHIEKDWVSLKMSDVAAVQHFENYALLDTGSPHYVKKVADVAAVQVVNEGRDIRYSETFKEAGVNVNFVEVINHQSLKVRTYERGVEDETFSCGTGATAAALVNYYNETGENSIDIEVLGGRLNISFNRNADGSYDNIWLKGPAQKVFSGTFPI